VQRHVRHQGDAQRDADPLVDGQAREPEAVVQRERDEEDTVQRTGV
jgi:hypothetical protein